MQIQPVGTERFPDQWQEHGDLSYRVLRKCFSPITPGYLEAIFPQLSLQMMTLPFDTLMSRQPR
jgi:hypothetical protein